MKSNIKNMEDRFCEVKSDEGLLLCTGRWTSPDHMSSQAAPNGHQLALESVGIAL